MKYKNEKKNLIQFTLHGKYLLYFQIYSIFILMDNILTHWVNFYFLLSFLSTIIFIFLPLQNHSKEKYFKIYFDKL